MLIRSQDKKQLIPLEDFVFSTYGSSIVCSKDIIEKPSELDARRIAKYSTEEKAVKVLDMIQNAYTQYGTLVDGRGSVQGAFNLPKVFQMPQDSEV